MKTLLNLSANSQGFQLNQVEKKHLRICKYPLETTTSCNEMFYRIRRRVCFLASKEEAEQKLRQVLKDLEAQKDPNHCRPSSEAKRTKVIQNIEEAWKQVTAEGENAGSQK